jgi:hypothetical protein
MSDGEKAPLNIFYPTRRHLGNHPRQSTIHVSKAIPSQYIKSTTQKQINTYIYKLIQAVLKEIKFNMP